MDTATSQTILMPDFYPVATDTSPVIPLFSWIGDRGVRVQTGDSTLARYAQLQRDQYAELEDVIPADCSLLLVLRRGTSLSTALQKALVAPVDATAKLGPFTHTIKVRYGGDAGPDLARLAEQAGLDPASYVARHCAGEYTVAFLGFQPGFPYLRGLPPALQVARRATPRVHVAAGSVAIGGAYTGIYPTSGPGGWHIIGHTETVMFDPGRPDPALLLPGDQVRFVADD